MKVRNTITGEEFAAHYTTESSVSSYGQAVLVLDYNGLAVDDLWFEIVKDENEKDKDV